MNLTLVTGLPRAGCGLLMAMLERGGLETLRNTTGSYRWSAAHELPANPRVLDAARGRVVHVPSRLLAFLPRLHHYRILFVDRPIGEIVVSEGRKRKSEASAEPPPPYEQARLWLKHRNGILSTLRSAPNVSLLVIDFGRLIETPQAEVARIRKFLGEDLLPEPGAMIATVEPRRHHVRLADAAVPASLKSALFIQPV